MGISRIHHVLKDICILSYVLFISIFFFCISTNQKKRFVKAFSVRHLRNVASNVKEV